MKQNLTNFKGFSAMRKILNHFKTPKKNTRSFWLFMGVILLSFNFGYSQSRIFEQIQDAKATNAEFNLIDVFSESNQRYTRANVFNDLTEVYLLNLNIGLRDLNEPTLSFEIPLGKQTVTLDLMEVEDKFYEYEVVTADGVRYSADRSKSRHYRGIIRGNHHSLVAISFFEDNVSGMISTSEGNFNLGKVKDTDRYILYNDRNLTEKKGFDCYTTDDDFINYDPEVLSRNTKDTRAFETNCVRLYFETEYDMFQNLGSVVAVENYVTTIYNQFAVIYYNEGIDTTISEINVWNSADPYSGGTSSMLSQFQTNITTFNGDLGHLITFRSGVAGLAAGFDGLCNSNPDLSLAVSKGLVPTITALPAFSYNVFLLAHEFGHLFGSRHTHACVWNGNNTAIDGCSSCQENPNPNGGGCNWCTQPPLPPNGGTIMSYCSLTSAGVDFNHGFGQQPGNVIRDRVANGSCLADCSSCPVSSNSFDIYSQDRPITAGVAYDDGTEPNPDTGPMWISEDIWVRQNLGTGSTTPENPEFKEFSANGVNVRVRNLSNTTSSDCAVLKVYFSKASTGLQWPTHFNNFYQNVLGTPVLHGDIIGTAILPAIPPNGVITVEIPWYPPNPADYQVSTHHFCLVSRILSPNDPMNSEVVGSVSPNVRNNNNIAWKNVSVYDATPNNFTGPTGVYIRGIDRESPFTNIRFMDEGFNDPIRKKFFDLGIVVIDLEPELFRILKDNGSLEGDGIKVIGRNKIAVSSREAVLEKFPLKYGETFYMQLDFKLYDDLKEGEEIILDVVQENAAKRSFDGGERFLIVHPKKKTSEVNSDGKKPSFNIVPNPNNGVFDIKLSNLDTGRYVILDIYGNRILEGEFENQDEVSIDISKMNTNLFFVKVISGETTINKVLVKK